MSERAVRCPHCGVVDERRDPRDRDYVLKKQARAHARGPTKLSADEAASLLSTAPRQRGFWADFLPNPGLTGLAWLLDALLVVMTLPLLLGIALALMRRRYSVRRTVTVSGRYIENVFVALLGAALFAVLAYQTPWWPTGGWIAFGSAGAMIARGFLGRRFTLD